MNNEVLEILSQNIQDFERNNDVELVDFNDLDKVYDAAKIIVEPNISDQKLANDYYEFVDGDKENWANFIKNNFGDFWHNVAKFVNENGY